MVSTAALPKTWSNFPPSLLLESRNTRNGTPGIGCPLSSLPSLLKERGMVSSITHPSATESLKIFFLTEKVGVFGKMLSTFVFFILHCVNEWLHLKPRTGSWKSRNPLTAAGAAVLRANGLSLHGFRFRMNKAFLWEVPLLHPKMVQIVSMC